MQFLYWGKKELEVKLCFLYDSNALYEIKNKKKVNLFPAVVWILWDYAAKMPIINTVF